MTRSKSILLIAAFMTCLFMGACSSSSTDTSTTDEQTTTTNNQATNNQGATTSNESNNSATNNAATNNSNRNNSNITRTKPVGPSPAKPDQIIFQNHGTSQGTKPKMGEYVSIHLEYYSPAEEVIYSSYTGSPNSFKLQPTLFNGVLNKGLLQMAEGDSASFYVPADSIFTRDMPGYIKSGESIRYSIKLLKVQTVETYMQEKSQESVNSALMDQQVIKTYLKENKLAAKESKSGLRYIIEQEGSGEPAGAKAEKVSVKYKLTTLGTGMVIEDTGDKVKKLTVSQQVKGLREALTTFPKGTKAKIIIPSVLGHGNRASGKIPPGSVLIYDLEIVDF